ncbi:MAG: hypothetical protein LBR64_01205 [Dysgonamonadaceae bacterium]|nr:hypothetical protein [Dysgonamonadaceae bacterium]
MNTGKYKIIALLFAALTLITVGSCIDDKGNYDYHEINEVTIEGIPDTITTSVGARVQVTPQLTFSQGENPDNFEYLWCLTESYYPYNFTDSVSIERNLDIEIGGEGSVINRDGTYYVLYLVINKETGVRYYHSFNIIVYDRSQIGYIMMCETGTDSFDLDLISVFNDTLTQYHRALELYNSDLPHTGVKPIDILCYGDYISPALGAGGKQYALWVLTDKWTNRVRVENFEFKPEFNISGISIKSDYLPENIIADKMISTAGHANSAGKAYVYLNNNWFFYNWAQSGWLLSKPINAASNISVPYKASSYLFSSYTYGAILFNETDNRFEYHPEFNEMTGPSTGMFKTTRFSPDEEIFNWENPNYRLVYMGNRDAFAGFAVVKNAATDKYELLQFNFRVANAPAKLGRGEFPSNLPMESIKYYAYHPTQPYLFLASEDHLYKVNTNTMAGEEVTGIIPAGHKISLMKNTAIRVPTTYSGRIIICTYDPNGQAGENGQMTFYDVASDGYGTLQLAKHPATPTVAGYQVEMRWTGFGKVIGVDYKQP